MIGKFLQCPRGLQERIPRFCGKGICQCRNQLLLSMDSLVYKPIATKFLIPYLLALPGNNFHATCTCAIQPRFAQAVSKA
jgi:hypothetical protein